MKLPNKSLLFGFLLVAVLAGMLSSCGMSKAKIEQNIRKSFQEKINSNFVYGLFDIQIQKITLTKSGRNSYAGAINVLVNGTPEIVSITVKIDSRNCIWEEVPFSYSFLVKPGIRSGVDVLKIIL
ncbi:hypothetical protein ACYULU_04160 [Breznakiellaceae bacterium SP9]